MEKIKWTHLVSNEEVFFLSRMKERKILHKQRVRLSGFVISCLETACKKTLLKERHAYKD
jgi:hypothetical protein